MEKLKTVENKVLIKFQEEIKSLVEVEITRKDAGEEYLDDLSCINPKELEKQDMEMYYFVKYTESKILEKDSESYISKFNNYKQEVKGSGSKSRWNFAMFLADRLMEKL